MPLFDIIALLLSLAALFAYINHRYVRLPPTIGVMVIALVVSLALIIAGEIVGEGVKAPAAELLRHIDFGEALLHGMLSLLLFAGALHIDLSDLRHEVGVVSVLSTIGVLLSTCIVGGLGWLVFRALGMSVPLLGCLILGALISPTDPIAVLGILKTAGAPRSLETQTAAESLFNDGIGVVVFLTLLDVAHSGDFSLGWFLWLFVKSAIGGLLFGIGAGLVTYHALRRVNNYQVEVMITLALATAGYALAERLHLSAPIAIVAAGLLIGNQGRTLAMAKQTEKRLDDFWELVDEILNAILFVLVGLQVLVMPLGWIYFLASAVFVPIVLLARWASVAAVVSVMKRWRRFERGAIAILTWGGLRGGLSVAMALSLPPSPYRTTLIAITYGVVVFSIVVQGITIGRVVRRFSGGTNQTEAAAI
jgi:CPA1 family monovalent cation:H+ antiporter